MIPWSLYFKRFPLQLLALAAFLAVTAGPVVLFIVSAATYPEGFQRGLEIAGLLGGATLVFMLIILIGIAWADTESTMPAEAYVDYIRGMSGVAFFVAVFGFLVGLGSV
jgi:hypothetical protein